ncbi:unnamed protein product [Effrenium voratum]|nr:unnamed protein product [Effrenium voratum]|mmetsp:Transcript_27431/g.65188  ORF Transcript_27431/g.65188 Transcript_27431/m.65188 type:complete len:569 (+) Transcript_27431:56-1762(+)
MVSRLLDYAEGGPNDPRTTFNDLRSWLSAVKEELSPWGWQAYEAEFRERMQAEKKLYAMNALPNSGAQPQDGVIQGTPLWQERLDQMLLVEHLKRKVMVAHTAFTEATDLLLKSHAWLVKDSLLADKFAECISRVPPSQHDRIDLLQAALRQSREETKAAKAEFHEYKVQQQIKRQEYLARTVSNQTHAIRRKMKDDILVSWRYQCERARSTELEGRNCVLVSRVTDLEAKMVGTQEDLEEAARQWEEQRSALEADRDEYKRLYEKFLAAHERAMAELEESQGTAEDQAKRLQVLTVEKHRLTDKVEELEDDKRRMAKQLSELRDEVAKLKAELRRLGSQLREGEVALLLARSELQQLRAEARGTEDVVPPDGEGPGRPALRRLLQESSGREAALRDRLQAAEATAEARKRRLLELEGSKEPDAEKEPGLEPASKIGILPAERCVRRHLERERDELLAFARALDTELVRVKKECFYTVQAIKKKAAQDLEDFRTGELAKAHADFKRQVEDVQRQRDMLLKEVEVADSLGPHLPTLNPLAGAIQDPSKVCGICRRAIVFEGALKVFPPK